MPGCRRIFKRDTLCVALCKCLWPQRHSFARLFRVLVDHKTQLEKCYLHRQGETLLYLTMVCMGRNGQTTKSLSLASMKSFWEWKDLLRLRWHVVGIASQTHGECAVDIIQWTSPCQYHGGSTQEANLAPTTLWGQHYHAIADKKLKDMESEQWSHADKMTAL